MLVAWVAIAALAPVGAGAAPASEEAAVKAATAWFDLLDSNQVDRAYQEADASMREKATLEQWRQVVQDTRAGLGRRVSRTLTDSQVATNLPGAPKGEYCVRVYKSRFDVAGDATETLTLVVGKDGRWRVMSYGVYPIRPPSPAPGK